MNSPTIFQRLTSVFRPGTGKRRKGNALPVTTTATPGYPPRPTEPPVYPVPTEIPENAYALDYREIERMLMDKIAVQGFGALSAFRDLYTVSVRRDQDKTTAPRPAVGTMTGRVVIRSNNPEMDAWVTRTAKTLVRPERMPDLSPAQFHLPAVPGMRIRLSAPAVTPVSAPAPARGMRARSALAVVSDTRTELPESADPDDLLLTEAWDNLFQMETHICRVCHVARQGTAHANGTWQCSKCRVTGRY